MGGGAQLNAPPSLCDLSAQKGTRSTGWKVKGYQAKKIAHKVHGEVAGGAHGRLVIESLSLVTMLGMGNVMIGRIIASECVITAQLCGREDGPLRQMCPEVHGA